MSRAERSRNLFSRKFFLEFVLSCLTLLLILLLFSREEEKERKVDEVERGYTFESLSSSITRIFSMFNCFEEKRFFVNIYCEIFFLL